MKRVMCFVLAGVIAAQSSAASVVKVEGNAVSQKQGKPVVYQIFTRLFGNTNTTNKPWGTLEENGVGKFNDINDAALEGIKNLGTTHVWYTGVLHHAMIRDYTAYGIANDDPDVVKGRAGSPYAVKDYFNVDPDLAVDPANRLKEFQALIARTHKHDLKVIIDIVPNHVARQYHSLTNPTGVDDFGAKDDTGVEYKRDNNFYYVVGKPFKVPESTDGYRPLNGEANPLSDGLFSEMPAKWTGNNSRKAQPAADDWYETVKINYGVRPDGTKDFPRLPEAYGAKSIQEHAEFWKDKDVPDSWKKFRTIAEYWLAMGVDGFRYDMAEMVPVEFWSYLNSSIKLKNPNAFLIAEVYTPSEYRNYIRLGKMDYLYDKVEMYDSLKAIMQNKGSTDSIVKVQKGMSDIEEHMLHFLENHDEQRIASPAFAGDAKKAMPAMVVSATISRSPTMLYFGQEVGEAGDKDAGYGRATRTTIFDYWGVPAHQRWMNGGKFDGGGLKSNEQRLRRFYSDILNLSAEHPAMKGEYEGIHSVNRQQTRTYDEKLFAFVRWQNDVDMASAEKLVVISNFAADKKYVIDLLIPNAVIRNWKLQDGSYHLHQMMNKSVSNSVLEVKAGEGKVHITLLPLESAIYSIGALKK